MINPPFSHLTRTLHAHTGAVYRPHVDGAWPGSGLDAQGRYLFDAHGGDRWSRLTFLIYLNGSEGGGGKAARGGGGAGGGGAGGGAAGSGEEVQGTEAEGKEGDEGFEGGATTFFAPSADADGCLDARGVAPRAGNILVFVHGDTAGVCLCAIWL